jgi:ABC-type branched-subunit amino acid transport system ATPase component
MSADKGRVTPASPAARAERPEAIHPGALRDAGAAVLWTEHYREPLMRTCDRLIVLRSGQKIAEGTVEEIQAIEAELGLTWL